MGVGLMQTLREMMIEHGIDIYLDDALAVHTEPYEVTDKVTLVGFQCGFDMLVCAVRSYLDVVLPTDEAVDIAEDYLREIEWLKEDAEPEIHVA